jgi:hypothetical protein
MVLYCTKNKLLIEISEKTLGLVYNSNIDSLLQLTIIYLFANHLCVHGVCNIFISYTIFPT